MRVLFSSSIDPKAATDLAKVRRADLLLPCACAAALPLSLLRRREALNRSAWLLWPCRSLVQWLSVVPGLVASYCLREYCTMPGLSLRA